MFEMSILCKHRERNSCLTIQILLKMKVKQGGSFAECCCTNKGDDDSEDVGDDDADDDDDDNNNIVQ